VSALAGKVVLVTGSSRGIGAAIATLFAQHGARVALHGRDEEALSAVRAAIGRGAAARCRARGRIPRVGRGGVSP
jgi:3-oxoacyl-[acyl-carrier protein] reductase